MDEPDLPWEMDERYESNWYGIPVSRAIGEHSTHSLRAVNYILCKSSSSGDLWRVEYFVIAFTPKST